MRSLPVRPVDSAGLLLIREGPAGPGVLMGRRRRGARFLPGAYVFPGGVVDTADRLVSGFPEPITVPAAGLDRTTRSRLRVFARTALRECYEETGALLEVTAQRERAAPPQPAARHVAGPGRASSGPGAPTAAPVWHAYARADAIPAFGTLLLVARAITPARSPIRFHTRFFMALVGSPGWRLSDQASGGDGELEDVGWVPVAETARLPVPVANLVVLREAMSRRARHRRAGGPWPASAAGEPAPCFTWRGTAECLHRTPAGPPGDA